MKFLNLVIVLLLLAPIGFAKTQTVILDRGESTAIDGINVTLIDYVKKDDKVLVCVNDEKAILSDDKRINQVYFEIRSFRDDGVKFILEADCDDCIESDNAKCFLKKNEKKKINISENINEIDDDETLEDLDDINDVNISGDDSDLENETVTNEIVVKEKKPYQGVLQRLINWIDSLFR